MVSTPALLELESVSRRLSGRAVLRDVSLTLARGDVLGLLGINGAGKSTTLSIIAGVLAADSGHIRLDGKAVDDDTRALRTRVGWVPENVPLWPELTVSEALSACARLRGLDKAAGRTACARELERLDLATVAHRVCGVLSLGQKRRVGLAQALLHQPDLLVLDEPGNGLDPLQTERLRQVLGTLARDHGIILSSHVLTDVAAMCNRVVILHAGRVRQALTLDGKPGQLEAQFRAIATQPVEAVA